MEKKLTNILKGCKKGKLKYQELLYKQFYGYGMSVSLRYSYSKEEAVEILNDSFLKVFNNIDKYNTKQEFKPWFRRIIINTAIDYYRKNSKIKLLNEPESEIELEPEATDNLNVEDILKLLNDLPEIYRLTFNLYEIEGYKHEEIAEMLSIAVSSSRANLTRAKKMLRSAFKKHFEPKYYEAI